MRLLGAFVLALAVALVAAAPAVADAFEVTDSDFSGGVYELHYYTSSNRLVVNGAVTVMDATPLSELFLTNSAYTYYGYDTGVRYLQNPGGFGSASTAYGSATMGFDLSAVTGQIAQVELLTRQYVFAPSGWQSAASGDQVFADIATPGAFGGGSYTNLYTFAADGSVGAFGSGTVTDVTSSLSAAWLGDPGLLEFRFGYSLVDTNNAGRHLQLFRDSSFWTGGALVNDGFMLRITLVSTPVPEPTTLALISLGASVIALRRRRRDPA